MICLLKPFIRSKLKLFFSLIAFVIIFISLIFLKNYEYKINEKMIEIENKVNNREITFMLDSDAKLDKIKKISNIVNIDINKMGEIYIINLVVDETKNLNSVAEKLDKMGIKVSLNDLSTQDELNAYKTIKLIFNIFLITIIVFFVIIIYIQLKLLIMWDMKEIGLLKVLGYNVLQIFCLVISKLYILITIAFVISCIIYIIASYIWNFSIIDGLLILPFFYSTVLVFFQIPVFLRKVNQIEIVDVL